jgi:uncharacterized protein (TIGR00661 family)
MRILYGVVGEGMGHAMRSKVILQHLVSHGHQVEVMASGRAVTFLKKQFGEDAVNPISGLHMIYEENRVRLGKTLAANILSGLTGVPENIAAYFRLVSQFEPQVVISDFESWTYLYGQNHRLPILSIDNMQIINRAKHPEEILAGHQASFQLTKAFVKSKLPFCEEYFITTFFRPELRKDRTSLFPPILRPEILEAKAKVQTGEHLLVYQTGEGYDAMLDALRQCGRECQIFGMRRDLKEEVREGNLRFMPFGEASFIHALATSAGVLASGGFTLMGEAVFLGKPMLAVPLAKQFEQIMNARYLEALGYGKAQEAVDDARVVQTFVEQLPTYQQKLASYTQNGNQDLLGAVDGFLAKHAS